MSKVAITGNASGTGTFTIAAPNSNTDRTLTLPDNTGTIITTASTGGVSQSMLATGVAGTGPSFSAYYTGAGQTFNGGVQTKVIINTEEWDTANCFDSTTNYRFTPNVAGYYHIIGEVQLNTASYTNSIDFFKNTSLWKRGTLGTTQSPFASCLVYLNGSTDYVEMYVYIATTAATQSTQTYHTYFQGFLARGA